MDELGVYEKYNYVLVGLKTRDKMACIVPASPSQAIRFCKPAKPPGAKGRTEVPLALCYFHLRVQTTTKVRVRTRTFTEPYR